MCYLFGLLVHVLELLLLRRPHVLVAREAVEPGAVRPRLVEQHVLQRKGEHLSQEKVANLAGMEKFLK